MRRLLQLTALVIGLTTVLARAVPADYRPLWILEDWFDYCLDVTNRGLRSYTVNDTQTVHTLAVTVREVLNRRPGSEGPDLAPGDSILILARNNWLKEDQAGYLVFVLYQVRRSYPGLPLPLFEGKALPCDRFLPMFTQAPASCRSSRELGADNCACAREAAYRYRELLEARKAGSEIEFLRTALTDENPIVVAGAMGILRVQRDPRAMEWMLPLVDHPEFQVRYDLAESIPYLAGDLAGQIGIRMLDDPDPKVQLIAGFGLGRMHYRPAEEKLAAILVDPQRERMVRATCLSALDRLGSPLLLPALEKATPVETDSLLAKGFREHLRKQREKAANPQEAEGPTRPQEAKEPREPQEP